jgi:hypothetical protein
VLPIPTPSTARTRQFNWSVKVCLVKAFLLWFWRKWDEVIYNVEDDEGISLEEFREKYLTSDQVEDD